jgi:hypothetical protein
MYYIYLNIILDRDILHTYNRDMLYIFIYIAYLEICYIYLNIILDRDMLQIFKYYISAPSPLFFINHTKHSHAMCM